MLLPTRPWIDVTRVRTPQELKVAAQRIDLFRFEPPEEIAAATDLAWLAAADGGYRLLLPQGEFTVQPTLLGDHEVRFRRHGAAELKTVGRGQNASAAVHVADDLVCRHYPDAVRLLSRDAGWRTRDATEKQRELLQNRGLPAPPRLSRGQASWMLSYVLHRR